MADATTIKEFLVALGYQIDASSERRFFNAIASATSQVVALGAAVSATAVAVVAGVAKMADEFENLYYMSRRTGATVDNIKAIGFAASQMGGSVEGMRGSLENLGRTLRTLPGAGGILQSLGIDPKQDPTKIMEQFARVMRDVPYYRAFAYAQALGIDERSLDALLADTGDFSRQYAEMMRAAGVNGKRAAEGSRDFMRELRGVGAAIDILGQKVSQELTGRLAGALRTFRMSIVANYDQITRTISAVANGFLTAVDVAMRMFTSLVDLVRSAIKAYQDADAPTKRFIDGLGLVAAGFVALNLVFASSPIGMILKLAAAIALLWDDYQAWKRGSEHALNWEKWEPALTGAWKLVKSLAGAIDALVVSVAGPNGWVHAFEVLAVFIAGSWLARVAKPILSVLAMLAMIPGSGVSSAAVGALASGAGIAAAGIGAAAVVGGVNAANAADGPGGFDPMKGVDTLLPGVGLVRRAWDWAFGARSRGGPGGAGPGRGADRSSSGAAPVVGNISGDAATRTGEAIQYFQSQGWSREQAVGIVANLHAESGMRPDAVGDGGRAYGAAQWHPDRQENFQRAMGRPIRGSSLAEQYAFVDWELKNTEQSAGARLREARTASEAAALVSRFYERPRDVFGESARRGASAERMMRANPLNAAMERNLSIDYARPGAASSSIGPVSQSNTFNVNGSMDGATAQNILSQLERSNQDLVRNLQGTTQ